MRDSARAKQNRDNSPEKPVDLERGVLRALCSGTSEPTAWKKHASRLAHYKWSVPEHAVIYEAVLQARRRARKRWREELSAQVTRMGFPDVDWADYLPPDKTTEPSSGAELYRLIRTLKAVARVRR